MIQEGRILVNGELKKANYKVQEQDLVEISMPEPRELDVTPEALELDIIYEDNDIILVNKPQNMVVHPAPGSRNGTLVNALLYHCSNLSGINGVIRPGIVHRIDKDTSGLLVVAKNDNAHHNLACQIKEHSMNRSYRAIIHGMLTEPSGTINASIGRDPKDRKRMAVVPKNSKEAITHYYVEERYEGYTEIKAVLETGRTHQIRVHMSYLKHPILGDPLYGPKKNEFGVTGQVLHAENLGFLHPTTGEKMEFSVEPPLQFKEIQNRLRADMNKSRE